MQVHGRAARLRYSRVEEVGERLVVSAHERGAVLVEVGFASEADDVFSSFKTNGSASHDADDRTAPLLELAAQAAGVFRAPHRVGVFLESRNREHARLRAGCKDENVVGFVVFSSVDEASCLDLLCASVDGKNFVAFSYVDSVG